MNMSSIIDLIKAHNLPVSKRTRSSTTFTSISNIKYDSDEEQYISATEFENFCENDPISDWFSVLSKKFMVEQKTEDNLQFLFNKGNEHEENIVKKLREMTGLPLEKYSSVKTSRDYDIVSKNIQKKDLEKTIQAMKNREPIIYNSFICDKKRKIRGIPDLLVRSDYISQVFKCFEEKNEDIKESSEASFPRVHSVQEKEEDIHYIPVEIKFSTVELAANNKNILNKGRMKIYKTQLFTYCKILQEMQGKFPSYALIIGKRTVLSNKEIKDSLEYPGFIDYSSYDSSYEITFTKGLEWLKDVKKNALVWTLDDIKNKQIFPNMKSKNTTFLKEKKEIADEYGEITDLWRCSTLNRNNALLQGIYSWKDPRFNSKVSSLSQPYRQSLENILKVNREDIDYYPQILLDQTFKKVENEMFVDFEIVRDSFDIESYGDSEWMFLIGVRYKGVYTQFIMNSLCETEEKRVIMEFYEYLSQNDFPKCWYWFAEVRFWNKAMERHKLDLKINWVDLYELFTKEGFAVKGSMNFKLKSYIKNLLKLNKINVPLPPDNCSDGISAMMIAWNYYESDESNKEKYEKEMRDVVYYNSLDCQYLDVMLTFARNNL